MRIVFFKDPRGPQHKLADFQIDVTEPGSLLEGLTIRGFALWRRKQQNEDELPYSVTFPARQYTNKDGEKDYYNFVNLTDKEDARYRTRFVRTVIDAFEKWERNR